MDTWQGTLSSYLAVALAGLASACASHLTKVQVAEVPVEQFQPTPVTVETSGGGQLPPIVDGDAPAIAASPSTAPQATATTASAAGPKPSTAPTSLDPAEEKVKTATKLMSTGRRADLLSARKMLLYDVGTGAGTQDEIRVLKLVCAKLGDRPCITKANQYAK